MNYKTIKMSTNRQGGFTLVEIAIVLMIIGLLIGGMLRGQELITSARVRNLIDQKNSIQTAHIGFMDRYRMLPGDLTAAQALMISNNGIAAVGGAWGGDGLFTPAAHSALYFQNLVAAGFLSCANCTAAAAGLATVANSPLNVFGGVVRVGQAAGSAGPAADNYWNPAGLAPVRIVIATGNGIESAILQEVDLKSDNGFPGTGNLRYGNFDAPAGLGPCVAPAAAAATPWANPTAANCEGAWFL